MFIAGVAAAAEHTILLGQLDPELPRAHYRVPDHVDFVGLPRVSEHAQPARAAARCSGSLRTLLAAAGEVDAVWLLGPAPALPRLRGACGAARQAGHARRAPGLPDATSRTPPPGPALVHLAGDLLEGSYRLLARRAPDGGGRPRAGRRTSGAPRRLLPISVSLVRDSDIVDPAEAAARPWTTASTRCSASAGSRPRRTRCCWPTCWRGSTRATRDWRLLICGEGPLEGELRERLRELGVADTAELLGYVPIHGGLMDRYRSVNAFLHVSWTEGMPQVLLEAFAAGTPVVATAVGGVPEAAGDAALLIPPGDPDAAAQALRGSRATPELRRQLVRSGIERVRGRTLEAESARVARFLADPDGSVQTADNRSGPQVCRVAPIRGASGGSNLLGLIACSVRRRAALRCEPVS